MSGFVTAAQYQLILPDAANTTYTMSGGGTVWHLALDGAGIPANVRHYQPFPNADGGADDGFKLDARRLAWKLFLEAADEAAWDTKRDALYDIFRPYQDPMKLKVTRVGGAVRQLDCFLNGPLDVDQSGQTGYSAVVTAPLVAPEPLWYDPTQVTDQETVPAGSGNHTVTLSGNWEEWPVIEVDGQVQDLVLTTTLTTAYRTETYVISFNGHTILNGDTYTIDLRPGRKTITDQSGNNRLATMANASWVGFRLWPAPFKTGGVNTIGYTKTTSGINARVRYKFYHRYLHL